MVTEIIAFIILVIVGLNLSANNAFISLLVNYVFYKDQLAKRLLRILGIVMALSSVLIIINETTYAIYVNILILLILTFFSIRGRNIAFKEKMSKRDLLLQEYANEIKAKRQKIEELRKKALQHENKSASSDNISVSDIKKKMWDDGTMTNKDLIDKLNK